MSESVLEPTLMFVPGISATGKTCMSKELVAQLNARKVPADMVIPFTTRAPRINCGERHGLDYRFIEPDQWRDTYMPQIQANPFAWDVDKIGGHYYFNRYDETIPSKEFPVKVLPVALSLIGEMIDKYSCLVARIMVLPVIISPAVYDRWLINGQDCRPGRDLKTEYAEQNKLLRRGLGKVDAIFGSSWNFEQDLQNFTCISLAMLGLE